jgi:hypothetical protein
VLDLMASQDQVAAQIVIELTYPSSGRVRDEELHRWRFDGDHKLAAPRHYVDTAKHIAAWNGEDTTRTA